MRRLFKSVILITLTITITVPSFGQDKKSDLKILYVGANPDKPLSEREKRYALNPERKLELQKRRATDFNNFLKQYFQFVTVIYGDEYTETMSADFDVTIIDTYLKHYGGGYERDSTGQVTGYKPRKYLTENFDYATIMIGEPSAFIGEGRQLKIDHLCLCLDAHAHSMKTEHVIFNKPFKVDISYEERETPGSFKARYSGRNLGKKMKMWRIQTEGYLDGKGFPIGLVSTGYGFENGIDAEWISGGVNSKGVIATALGRHANFFHWGFAAAPEYMTSSAKLAFINAIHYIAQFKGEQQITRKIKMMPLRQYEREQQWTVSDRGSEAWLHYVNKDTLRQRLNKEKAQKKQKAGEKLNELEKIHLQMPIRKETREWTIRHEPDKRKEAFGKDWVKYENFYKENMGYLYPVTYKHYYKTDVDKDAKALGIPNNDIKLLDTAVNMLLKGDRVDMAKRLLIRYTGESFESVNDWEKWLKKNRSRLYFSEGDGYKYIVLPD
ncbi:hypothetical protein L3X37_07890 [Sabulilitoribacter arenilitoris]|uniref:Uncharacterized protein n=1 Tax=Wocania arenilitoris TaxID=2044858 RepID=A0AAE3JKN4_9FLAO|nr:hypothetical protein [Wocania arenilitoris]MCF7568283.1 hypothetical protein [Wocania arenilitoris]